MAAPSATRLASSTAVVARGTVGRGDLDPPEPVERAGDRRIAGVRLHTGDGRRGDERATHLLGRSPDRGRGVVGARPQPPLDLGEALRGEQPLEHGAPVFGARAQESGEVALGEHHDLVELLRGHVQVFLEQRIGFGRPGGPGHPRAVDELLDEGLRRVLTGADPALAGKELTRLPHDPVPPGPKRHLEPDLGGRRTRGVMGTQTAGETGARDLAEERERHRVEDGGLAGARRSVQEEEAGIGQPVEVDRARFRGTSRRP